MSPVPLLEILERHRNAAQILSAKVHGIQIWCSSGTATGSPHLYHINGRNGSLILVEHHGDIRSEHHASCNAYKIIRFCQRLIFLVRGRDASCPPPPHRSRRAALPHRALASGQTQKREERRELAEKKGTGYFLELNSGESRKVACPFFCL